MRPCTTPNAFLADKPIAAGDPGRIHDPIPRARSALLLLVVGSVLCATDTSRADPNASVSGLSVSVYAETGGTGLAWGVGAFGADLFVANGGSIQRVGADGTITNFVSGLGSLTSIGFSSGGAFGETLYATDDATKTLLAIDASGNIRTVHQFDPRTSNLTDLAVGPAGSSFESSLLVADGGFLGSVSGKVWSVDASGNTTVLAEGAQGEWTPQGLLIADTRPFGDELLITDARNHGVTDGSIRQVDGTGTPGTNPLQPGERGTVDPNDLALGLGGVFGDGILFSDWSTNSLLALARDGTLTELANGFDFGSWRTADLLWSPNGDRLLIADDNRIWAITTGEAPPVPEPATIALLALSSLGVGLRARRRRRGLS